MSLLLRGYQQPQRKQSIHVLQVSQIFWKRLSFSQMLRSLAAHGSHCWEIDGVLELRGCVGQMLQLLHIKHVSLHRTTSMARKSSACNLSTSCQVNCLCAQGPRLYFQFFPSHLSSLSRVRCWHRTTSMARKSSACNLYICISIYLYIYFYISTYLYFYISMYLYIYISIYLSIFLYIYLSIYIPFLRKLYT